MATILGISAFYHDSAAALMIEGEIIAAAGGAIHPPEA
jgi:predicted NodU family carbamoyl transferase